MNMKKRILSFLLSSLFMLPLSTTICATQVPSTTPLWENINGLTATLTFNSNTGNVTVVVTGKTNVTNITATVDLYYKNSNRSWVEVEND